MLQKLPKLVKVAQKTESCSKVAGQLVDRATLVTRSLDEVLIRFNPVAYFKYLVRS